MCTILCVYMCTILCVYVCVLFYVCMCVLFYVCICIQFYVICWHVFVIKDVGHEQSFSFCVFTISLHHIIFLKSRHSLSEKGLKILVYCINTVMECGTCQPVNFQLVSHHWTVSKMKWFLSNLWINVANINSEVR